MAHIFRTYSKRNTDEIFGKAKTQPAINGQHLPPPVGAVGWDTGAVGSGTGATGATGATSGVGAGTGEPPAYTCRKSSKGGGGGGGESRVV